MIVRLEGGVWCSAGVGVWLQEVRRGGPRVGGGLEEIRRGCSRGDHALGVRHGAEQFGLFVVGVGEGEDGRDVSAPVAIVRRRPNRHKLLVKHVLIS